jgi:hypothetical protein
MFNEVPVALRLQNNFDNHNMTMYKSNDSNLSDSCKTYKKEKRLDRAPCAHGKHNEHVFTRRLEYRQGTCQNTIPW